MACFGGHAGPPAFHPIGLPRAILPTLARRQLAPGDAEPTLYYSCNRAKGGV
jgi:hypothetical protein